MQFAYQFGSMFSAGFIYFKVRNEIVNESINLPIIIGIIIASRISHFGIFIFKLLRKDISFEITSIERLITLFSVVCQVTLSSQDPNWSSYIVLIRHYVFFEICCQFIGHFYYEVQLKKLSKSNQIIK